MDRERAQILLSLILPRHHITLVRPCLSLETSSKQVLLCERFLGCCRNHIKIMIQDSKSDRECRGETMDQLLAHLRKLFPKGNWIQIGSYAGLRPASPNSDDYLIKMDLVMHL